MGGFPTSDVTTNREAIERWLLTDTVTTAGWTTSIAMPLVRGLSHALGNRVGSLAALLEVVLDPELTADERVRYESQIRGEIAQLGSINEQLRLIPADRLTPEPMLVDGAVEAAIALASFHRDRRGGALRVTVEGTASPVRVGRWVLIHVLVAMLDVSTQRSGWSILRVSLGGTPEEVEIRIASDPDAPEAPRRRAPAPRAGAGGEQSREAAGRLAESIGGTIEDLDGGALCLRLPSLAALRVRQTAP